MKMQNNKTVFILVVALVFIGGNVSSIHATPSISNGEEYPENRHFNYKTNQISGYMQETYTVVTDDGAHVTLTRYVGHKKPSVMLVHGAGCNHRIFDWDENHSLARFLNNHGYDVWMLDLRTHDGDGDFAFGKLRGIDSDKERINRYWDFDRTYLKKDVVAAVEFIKNKSGCDKFFFAGHSLGGYLAYAYAELISQDDLAGIITTGASAMANPIGFSKRLTELYKYGFKIGKRAFVRPFGRPYAYYPKILRLISKYEDKPKPHLFYNHTTPAYIQRAFLYARDDEPAGIIVDMLFGKDPRFYSGHWVDPQTLYDYTENLKNIEVPLLAIAGDEDLQDPVGDVFASFVRVSSKTKKFLHYPEHSHMDLLLGENASILIFPEITNWLDSCRVAFHTESHFT
jgi:pimeloyl-ACP methyl ester carboxylesterase